ncbi:MAG: nitronate monooxygenase family protein, partial [Lachnospiraceae bacterium]|nr:nitronate monooxygenase family protein [Lachnospiraceae bacterium]
IGFGEEGFEENQKLCNLRAIEKHVKRAKEYAREGLVGVNVMVALKDYAQHVRAAVKAGVDVVISGAGLPVNLPELVEGSDTKIAPIVSSEKAANVILRMWDRKYKRTADFVVIEGPKAGGHLGFSREELAHVEELHYDSEIKNIIRAVKEYGKKFGQKIPVIVAGGIFSGQDVSHVMELGADGVQVASRFVATEECDASDAYKQAYVQAGEQDVELIQSPVGMPGRALKNAFLEEVKEHSLAVGKCYGCLAKCKPSEIPYCITDALIKAVKGDVEHGLVFCGANVGKIHEITTVHQVMEELCRGI